VYPHYLPQIFLILKNYFQKHQRIITHVALLLVGLPADLRAVSVAVAVAVVAAEDVADAAAIRSR